MDFNFTTEIWRYFLPWIGYDAYALTVAKEKNATIATIWLITS